jgi:hypothetical protein
MSVRLLFSGAILVLAACGGADPGDEPAPTDTPQSGVLLDYAQRPMERARGIEDLAAGRRDELDEQVEASER